MPVKFSSHLSFLPIKKKKMTVPQPIIDLLKLREGFRSDVYLDTVGKPTAGMGHLLSSEELAQYPVGTVVPDDVLNEWIQDDTVACYVAGMSQARQIGSSDSRLINALSCVSFQLGAYWYNKFPHCWNALKAHNWQQAANEAQDSEWYKQTPVRVEDFQNVLYSLGQPATAASHIG